MDLKTLLINRRAVRDYRDKEVPLSIIKELLQDTCLAPTARNGQPCRFIIINDRNLIKRLSAESKANILADAVKNPDLLTPDYEAILRDENFNVFYNAPCLVLFIGPNHVESLDVNVALTVAYFMFSATARELATCWIGLGAHVRDS